MMNTKQLIDRYHEAWTQGDFTTARGCLADNLDFQGSMETFSNAEAFIEALQRFRQIVNSPEPAVQLRAIAIRFIL
jgi:hypothetical protein